MAAEAAWTPNLGSSNESVDFMLFLFSLRNLFALNQYRKAAKDKKPFPFLIPRNCGGCARRIQTQTWRRCLPRSESYQRRSLQGSAEQSQLFDSQCDSSINLREIVPLKFHYSFHHDVGLSSLHLSASVVSKGLLTQQSDIKWRGGGGGGGGGGGLRRDGACGSLADWSDLCRRLTL